MANVHHHGEAEKVLNRALKKRERSAFVLANKVFFPMCNLPNLSGLSR